MFISQDVSVDRDFVDLLEKIQKQRHLVCNYGNTLRHDEIKKGDVTRVLDTDDPVTVLFEYMKQKNLRLIDLLHNLDRDHSDTISRDEFQQGLSASVCILLQSSVVDFQSESNIYGIYFHINVSNFALYTTVRYPKYCNVPVCFRILIYH